MLAKMTTKNRLTLPKAITNEVGDPQYFEIETRAGQIILTPVRIQRSDAVRAKLMALGINETDIQAAVDWSRGHGSAPNSEKAGNA